MTGLMGEKLALDGLAKELSSFLSPEFSRVELEYTAAGPVGQAKVRAVRFDETSTTFPRFPQIHTAVKALRSAMYRPDSGTWFSMRMSVSAAGSVDVSFNYDEQPPTSFDFAPDAFAADLVKFPRDEAHIPKWLREQLEAHQ